MTRNRGFRGTVSILAVLLLALTGIAASGSGGFALQIDLPRDASSDVVLHVRADGCHQPAKARVSGTAEGIVNGERRSIPLTLTKVGLGTYSITQQWPDAGTWVLAFSGTYRGRQASTVVTLDTNSRVAMHQNKPAVRAFPRALSELDIATALVD